MPQQVVIDGRSFDPAFLPEQLVHRGSQLRELESYLSPLLKEPPLAARALIVGPRGSGKTTISRQLVNRYLAENPEAMGFVVLPLPLGPTIKALAARGGSFSNGER